MMITDDSCWFIYLSSTYPQLDWNQELYWFSKLSWRLIRQAANNLQSLFYETACKVFPLVISCLTGANLSILSELGSPPPKITFKADGCWRSGCFDPWCVQPLVHLLELSHVRIHQQKHCWISTAVYGCTDGLWLQHTSTNSTANFFRSFKEDTAWTPLPVSQWKKHGGCNTR